MVDLLPVLELETCPHCSVNSPNLVLQKTIQTENHSGGNTRFWGCYKCNNCGGIVIAWARATGFEVQQIFPSIITVDELIPPRAQKYLSQAISSLHVPSGAVMLAASAVDAMLKYKGYKDDSLYSRINKAAKDHIITEDMATWAHQVRLDANDERHSDEKDDMPTEVDAKRSIDFALALGEFLFVLPGKVTRGLKESKDTSSE